MTITSVLSARDKIGYGLGDMASALLGMALLLIFYKLNSQTADRIARERRGSATSTTQGRVCPLPL